jgi:hypothetical protein
MQNTASKANQKLQNWLLIILALIIFGGLIFASIFYLTNSVWSKPHLNNPVFTHYHFRLQLSIDEQKIDFSQPKFQFPVVANAVSCDAELSDEPIHFHDNKDQLAHIHWKGVTGGEVLKFYGLNYIGGLDSILGFRFDENNFMKPVNIAGNHLPKPKNDSKIWVYTGDSQNYKVRNADSFLKNDLEKFFKGQDNVAILEENQFIFTPKVNAHSTRDDPNLSPEIKEKLKLLQASQDSSSQSDSNADSKKSSLQQADKTEAKTSQGSQNSSQISSNTPTFTEQELKEINNLIGDVVVFIQKDEPSPEQIKQKFDTLVALDVSTCGG